MVVVVVVVVVVAAGGVYIEVLLPLRLGQWRQTPSSQVRGPRQFAAVVIISIM